MLAALKRRAIIMATNAVGLIGRLRRGRRKLPAKIENIALWQFGGIGDMVLATPIIRALAQAYPEAKITLICSHPQYAGFMCRFDNVAAIKGFDIYALDARTLWHKSARKSFPAMRRFLHGQGFDLIVNLHVPALIDWWAVELLLIAGSRARYCIGFQPPWLCSSWPYDAAVEAKRPLREHYVRLYAKLLAAAGLPAERHTLFPLTDADRASARQLLKAHGADSDRPFACVHVGGRRLAYENKLWSAASFATLLRMLSEQNVPTVLVGTSADLALADAVCDQAGGGCNLAGRTSMGELAAVIERAGVFIGHDSGPFHIAVAVGTPAVAICGRPDAEPQYLDYGCENVAVLTADRPQDIDVKRVAQAAMRLLVA